MVSKEFADLVRSRKSCRSYSDRPVSEEQLLRVLDAARLAPSWKNRQCWTYVVVSDPDIKLRIGRAVGNNPDASAYQKAPYVIVVCADPSLSGNIDGKQYYMTDCGISLEHFCLAASAEGLATCWVGLFEQDGVRQVLSVPENIEIVALTPLGYSFGGFTDKPRKPMEQFACLNKWGEPFAPQK